MAESARADRLAALRRRRAAQVAGVGERGPGASESDARVILTRAQRRLWEAARTDPTGGAFTVGMSYRFRDSVPVGTLIAALDRVAAAHPALRSTLTTPGAGPSPEEAASAAAPRVIVHDRPPAPPRVVDESDHADAAAEAMEMRWDLHREAPVRFIVGVADADAARLAIVAHHLWWDDACWAILARDVDAALRGEHVPPRSLAAPEPTRPAPSAGDGRGASACLPTGLVAKPGWGAAPAQSIETPIAPKTGRRVMERCRELGVRPAAVVLAALAEAMPSPEAGVTVAMPVLLRHDDPAEGAPITYRGNSVLIDVPPGWTGDDAVHSAAGHLADALDDAELDIADVLQRHRTTMPDVSLVFEETRAPGPCGSTGAPLRNGIIGEPLSVRANTAGGALEVSVDHQPGRVPPGVAHAFAGRLARAIRAFAEPDGPAAGTTTGDAAAVEGTDAGGSAESPVELIAEWFRDTPGACAVREGDCSWTYGELETEVRSLAGELARRNPRRAPIAYALGRGHRAITVLLACLRAGIPVTEISPRVPAARLAAMLVSADVHAVVHGDDCPDAVRRACGDGIGLWDFGDLADPAATVAAVASRAAVEPLTRGVPDVAPDGDDVACIVFTSGTTGLPKPVDVTHRGLARHAEWALRGRRRRSGIRLLHAAPPGFDASIGEVVMTLAAGGELLCAPTGTEFDARRMLDHVAAYGATIVHGVPAVVEQLVLEAESRPADALGSVEWVLCGGDRFPGPLRNRMHGIMPRCSVANCYGPTETTLAATMGILAADPVNPVVHVGEPRPDLTAEILDEKLRPVPDGRIGELYLSGDGLARGYRGMAAETAARFVAAPGGRRRYRTGDLASRTPEGLVCHGRIDDQVKVRGVRFEPGDVEAALLAHPGVHAAAVTVRDGVVRGFAVTDGGHGNRPDLVAHAARLLPEAMVPAVVEALGHLPLNRNGKVDRDALARRPLPSRESGDGGARAASAATPGTPAPLDDGGPADRIAAMMAECLGADDVGVDDSFFALGGHSLMVLRLTHRLRELGLHVTMRDVIDNPTARALARLSGDGPTGSGAVARVGGDARYGAGDDAPDGPADHPLTPAQHRMWVIDRVTDDGYRIVVPMVLRGPRDDAALIGAVADVVAAHEGLRTTYPVVDGHPVQRIHPDGPTLAWTNLPAGEVPGHVAQMLARRWNVAEEIPVHFECVAVGAERAVLVVAVHHIAADHSSLETLFDHLAAAYEARLGNSRWSPGPIAQPRDIGAHARRSRSGPGAAALGRWWAAELEGYVDLPEPPAAHPGASPRAGVVRAAIGGEAFASAARRAADEGITPFAGFLAEVARVLAAHTGRDDLIVGVPAAIPDAAAAESVALGVDLVPVRLNRADAGGTDARRAAFVALADAIGHAELPFDDIVRAVGARRAATTRPLVRHLAQGRNQRRPRMTDRLEWAIAPTRPADAPYDTTWDLEIRDDGDAFIELVYDRRYVGDDVARSMHRDVLEAFTAAGSRSGEPGANVPCPTGS